MKRTAQIVVVLALAVSAACSGPAHKAPRTVAAAKAENPIENGQSIFQNGRDLSGMQITAQSKPLFQSCSACHGRNGAGGHHFSDGAVSADLRHHALVTEQQHPYTFALLKRAISTGIDNEGKPLDRVMPRWKLSKADLNDVAEYVLTKLK